MRVFCCLILLGFTLSCLAEDAGGYDYIAAQQAEIKAKKDKEEAELKEKKAADKKMKQIQQQTAQEKWRREILPENIRKLDDVEVCTRAGSEWRSKKTDNYIQELYRRKMGFNLSSVKEKSIKINGYSCDVLAVFGRPNRYNRSVNAYHTHAQFVYDWGYVYTEDGVITSWSD